VTGYSRRAFVTGTAGLGLALALDACSSPSPPSPYAGQLRTVALAAALENQAVSAYRSIDSALTAGKLGPAIPALAAFVKTAMAHHVQHAATWNAILAKAHKPTVTGTPLSGNGQVMDTIGASKDAEAAIAALQHLETQAAQTHTAAISSLTNLETAVTAAAAIAPVEAMHAATLGYLFGGQSAVAEFIGTGGALSIKELTL
jgi:hypothetical protein